MISRVGPEEAMVSDRTMDQVMLAAGLLVIVVGVAAYLDSGDWNFLVVPAMLLVFIALEGKKFRRALTKS